MGHTHEGCEYGLPRKVCGYDLPIKGVIIGPTHEGCDRLITIRVFCKMSNNDISSNTVAYSNLRV